MKTQKLKVLIACEESQAVCKAFRNLGHEAFSCDIQECSGGHQEWHIKGNVLEQLDKNWDLIIAHPPCTYLTVTGNRWFNIDRYGDKAKKRLEDREEAICFFMEFVNAPCKYIAIENPVGCMNTIYRKPDQIIQPYQFGDAFEKKTCLWLKNLPKLLPTKIVKPPERVKFSSGKTMAAWYNDARGNKEYAKIRSKTFQGIADAMAIQWSEHILKDQI